MLFPGVRSQTGAAAVDHMLVGAQPRFLLAARVRCSSCTCSSVNRVLTAMTSRMGCAGSDGRRSW